MINVFITIFIAIIIGVALVGPLSDQVNLQAGPCGFYNGSIYYGTNANGVCTNGTQTTNTSYTSLYQSGPWGSTILKLVPGLFVLIILGVVVAGLYSVFRQAGIV